MAGIASCVRSQEGMLSGILDRDIFAGLSHYGSRKLGYADEFSGSFVLRKHLLPHLQHQKYEIS